MMTRCDHDWIKKDWCRVTMNIEFIVEDKSKFTAERKAQKIIDTVIEDCSWWSKINLVDSKIFIKEI